MKTAGRLALALLLISAVPALAQAPAWEPVPCSDSPFRYSPELSCFTRGSPRGATSGIQAVARWFAVSGNANGGYVNLLIILPVGDTYIRSYTNEEARRAFRNYNSNVTNQSENWGELRNLGSDVSYATFKMNGQNCVGIDQAGPMKGQGYSWQISGYSCRTGAIADPPALVKEILAGAKIGG